MVERHKCLWLKMMTPHVLGKEYGAELRQALFRARLLLAVDEVRRHKWEAAHQLREKIVSFESDEETANATLLLKRPAQSISSRRLKSESLRTLDFEEEGVFEPEEQHELLEVKEGVEEPVPLPPLRWSAPTRQERMAALENNRKRRKQCTDLGKPLWFRSIPTTLPVRRTHGSLCSEPCARQESGRGHFSSSAVSVLDASPSGSSSSLTPTEERSNYECSEDTYAVGLASADDHYALERTPFRSPLSSCHTPQYPGVSGSSSILGNCRRPSMSSECVCNYLGGGGVPRTEMERILAGEEEPYASYLFSPSAHVVDLSAMHPSGAPGSRDPAPNKDSSSKHPEVKDGCTRVLFSPDGACYLVGTRMGLIWFFTLDATSAEGSSVAPPQRLEAHSGPVADVAFNDIGTFFASAGGDACVILWNQRTRLKVRRINTEAGDPYIVRFMPKNNNYLLASHPRQQRILLYNVSTGRPVMWKGTEMKLEATAVAVYTCTHPFLFVGDTNGELTMWRYCVGGDASAALRPFEGEARRESEGEESNHELVERKTNEPRAVDAGVSSGGGTTTGIGRGRQCPPPHSHLIAESQPYFEKVAALVLEKGVPIGALVASTMSRRQLRHLTSAQRLGKESNRLGVIMQWTAAVISGALQRYEHYNVLGQASADVEVQYVCAVMLLASLPCDRHVLLCVEERPQPAPEYKIIPMLVINRACRVRQPSAGIAFCLDNTRFPTFASTCEEGFIQVIACTARRLPNTAGKGCKRENLPTPPAPLPWTVMATLAVPCGGIPCSIAWSADMRLLLAVTEDGTLYQWQRVYLHNLANRDWDESTLVPQAQDEVDEWRDYFEREKERQMHRCRVARRCNSAFEDPTVVSGSVSDGSRESPE